MIACMVIVCKLLTQIEDADEKRDINNAIAQSLENPQPPSVNHVRPNDPNHMAPRPAVIRQSWMGSGKKELHWNIDFCMEINTSLHICRM